jgi:hypothetical protein
VWHVADGQRPHPTVFFEGWAPESTEDVALAPAADDETRWSHRADLHESSPLE